MSRYGYDIILDEAMKVKFSEWKPLRCWFEEPAERPPSFRYLSDNRPTPVYPMRKYEDEYQQELRSDERRDALRDRLHIYYGSVNDSFTICDKLCEWLQDRDYTLAEFKEVRREVLREREEDGY